MSRFAALRRLLLLVLLAATAFGGSFTCKSSHDSDDFTKHPRTPAKKCRAAAAAAALRPRRSARARTRETPGHGVRLTAVMEVLEYSRAAAPARRGHFAVVGFSMAVVSLAITCVYAARLWWAA
jgi:hypothetical protein